MTQQEAVDLMKSSKSRNEWDTNCDKVKAAHGGQYPDYWYSAIVASGLATKVAKSFGKTAGIKVSRIPYPKQR